LNRALAHALDGNTAAATTDLQSVLKSDPSNQIALAELQKLGVKP
jgi:hypothetical protein